MLIALIGIFLICAVLGAVVMHFAGEISFLLLFAALMLATNGRWVAGGVTGAIGFCLLWVAD